MTKVLSKTLTFFSSRKNICTTASKEKNNGEKMYL